MKFPLSLIFAATLTSAGIAAAQTPAPTPPSPTAPSANFAPSGGPVAPGSPAMPVAPGALPEKPAPSPAAPSPAQATPINGQAAPKSSGQAAPAKQDDIPSAEVNKAQQTGQSANGGKTTEDATPVPAGSSERPMPPSADKNKSAQPTPPSQGNSGVVQGNGGVKSNPNPTTK